MKEIKPSIGSVDGEEINADYFHRAFGLLDFSDLKNGEEIARRLGKFVGMMIVATTATHVEPSIEVAKGLVKVAVGEIVAEALGAVSSDVHMVEVDKAVVH